jgi:hypothetical protein
MTQSRFNPRALFLSKDGSLYSDTLICSGLLPAQLGGKPCPYAVNKQMPEPVPLPADGSENDALKGQPGDLCPPCAHLNAGPLRDWDEHERYFVPEELLPLRLFQCKQAFWLVVMGLYDADATQIEKTDEPPDDE